MSQGYQQYSKAYKKSAVNTVDQRKLIVLMYDGAIKHLSFAAQHLKAGKMYESHTHLVNGKSIVAELLASLNMEKGGEIAINLQNLYIYMFNQLVEANVQKDAALIEHVVALLKELREAWKDMVGGKAEGLGNSSEIGGIKAVNVRG